MDGRRDILPMIIAAAVALVVTVLVRWLISSNYVAPPEQRAQQKEVSMPDIPLMVKEMKKEKDGQVLVVAKDIKKDDKIIIANLSWKKWPQSAMQPYFIAKDEKDTPLNNKEDYNNALKMWAATNIPAGAPIAIRMLTKEDPAERKRKDEEEKKKEEEKKEKERKETEKSSIRKGMRAVTFAVDQKSSGAASLLSPGDLVDILIITRLGGERARTYKYKSLRVIAIDGRTLQEQSKKQQKKDDGLFSGLGKVGNLLGPQNVTLEVKENLVEPMLRRAGNNGIILSVRNQEDQVDKDAGEEELDEDGDFAENALLQNMININRSSSSLEILERAKSSKDTAKRGQFALIDSMYAIGGSGHRKKLEASKRRKDEFSAVIQNMNKVNSAKSAKDLLEKRQKITSIIQCFNSVGGGANIIRQMAREEQQEASSGVVKRRLPFPETGRYEVVSGKIRGKKKSKKEKKGTEGDEEEDARVVVIHRLLKSTEVPFDLNGKRVEAKDLSQSLPGSPSTPIL
ncbi:MAG: hypothetical protein LBS14_03660 [Holosporaceae bacterium]|jgi:Flp pilus assembly protein CpaB|nr:hypothetical protein [Holosporaceae bacterium]